MKAEEEKAMVVVIMGVSGVGKSTVGKLLARQLGWSFFDADDFHPEENVAKMHSGVALEDTDRIPWLRALNKLVEACINENQNAVLACSALRASYRNILREGIEEICFVFLSAPVEVIQARLNKRTGHFMSPLLLASQFETLEVPDDAVHVSAEGTPADVVAKIRRQIGV